MSTLVEVIQRMVRPYSYYILAIIVLILFIVAGNYAYNTFYTKKDAIKDKGFNDVANANTKTNKLEAIIYFFHVDWCPHCKTALPDWNRFKNDFHGKEFNKYVLKCITQNCTDETSDITKLINDYGIQGYPTVKMLKDGNKIEFDSKISYDTLEQFANTMME
jgi:thiol-disulfide isomerase/thioredoxin